MGRIEYLRKHNKPTHHTFIEPYKLSSFEKTFRRVMSSFLQPSEELIKITEEHIEKSKEKDGEQK